MTEDITFKCLHCAIKYSNNHEFYNILKKDIDEIFDFASFETFEKEKLKNIEKFEF